MASIHYNEDKITDILVNLLREKKYVRDIILKRLFDDISNEVLDSINPDTDISSQFQRNNGLKPDIVIENDNCFLIIENKIYRHTQLTEGQPIGYFDMIRYSQAECKYCVFLIPVGYSHEGEICDGKSHYYKETRDCLLIKYWRDLLDELGKCEIPELDKYIQDLREIISNAYNDDEEESYTWTSDPDEFASALRTELDICKGFYNFLTDYENEEVEISDIAYITPDNALYNNSEYKLIGCSFSIIKGTREHNGALVLKAKGNLGNEFLFSFVFRRESFTAAGLKHLVYESYRNVRIFIPLCEDESTFCVEEEFNQDRFSEVVTPIFDQIISSLYRIM